MLYINGLFDFLLTTLPEICHKISLTRGSTVSDRYLFATLQLISVSSHGESPPDLRMAWHISNSDTTTVIPSAAVEEEDTELEGDGWVGYCHMSLEVMPGKKQTVGLQSCTMLWAVEMGN